MLHWSSKTAQAKQARAHPTRHVGVPLKPNTSSTGNEKVNKTVLHVVVVLLCCCGGVVVVVEWLFFSKRIIIVREADLGDMLVGFRQLNVCY